MCRFIIFILTAIILLGATASMAYSADHPSQKDIEQLLLASESIWITEFKGYDTKGKISLDNPPSAIYRIVEYLKGPPFGVTPIIKFEFDIKPTKRSKWKFKKSMMPKLGSKWILFIPNAIPTNGKWLTYKGAKGRIPYDDKNLDKILKAIDKYKAKSR